MCIIVFKYLLLFNFFMNILLLIPLSVKTPIGSILKAILLFQFVKKKNNSFMCISIIYKIILTPELYVINFLPGLLVFMK